MTAATVESQTVPEPPKLHQPKRALIAVGEVVLGVLLVLVAAWCWQRGVEHHSYSIPDREPLGATRYRGNWIGAAVALATVAGVLLLDAIRQVVLAVRTRQPEDSSDEDFADRDSFGQGQGQGQGPEPQSDGAPTGGPRADR
ncbi:hypothetical protein [Saccharothrix xinjiangensis]|uniref:Uncharacterized protein n=1 Tax=Saccharothrix xinjiangensis TaxID=204798 RepID=A0ABV9Y6J7_9PSEU